MSVKRNIALNALGQMGNRVVRILEQLLLVPFFLSVWGPEYYGEWLTISIIPSVLAFSDLGFGTAISNSFVLSYSSGKLQKAANTYITGLIITTFTVTFGIILSLIILLWGNHLGYLGKSIIPTSAILYSLAFLMASRLMGFYMQLFEGFFRAKSKASIAFHSYSAEGLFRIIVGIVCLLLHCDVVGFALGQFVVALIFNIAFAIYAIRLINDLPSGKFDKELGITTFRKGFGFMLTPIWQSIYMQGSTFVVRIVLGPAAVAVFNTVRTVCKSINAAFSIVNGSIFPEVQIAYGKGNTKLVKDIYIYSMQIVFGISMIGLFFLLIFGSSLYGWWTHNELTVTKAIWSVFMLGIPLNALWWTAGTVFRAINKPLRFSLLGFVASIISTLISYILSYPLDLLGAAIGFVAMDFIMLMLTLPLSNKEVGVKVSELFDFSYAYQKIFRR